MFQHLKKRAVCRSLGPSGAPGRGLQLLRALLASERDWERVLHTLIDFFGSLCRPASSEGGGGPETAAAGGASAGPGREGGAHCAAGVPPGLNPLAVVEVRCTRHIDCPETRVGAELFLSHT